MFVYDLIPTKWKKYLLLERYGLQELANIRDGIRRYARGETESLLSDIKANLVRDEADSSGAFYVVKLVPLVQQGQLPNYRIHHSKDLAGLPDFLCEHENGDHVEVWFCRTAVSSNLLSTAGRIVFTDDGRQVVEHVDGCSPRLIESFSSRFQWPFVRASRLGWGRRFAYELIHIPAAWPNDPLPAFRQTVALLEERQEMIRAFCEHLESRCFSAYSLEYKLVGSWFSIIDWDTPDDLKVL